MTAIGPGSIVVCVDAKDIERYDPLCEGARYVVRDICRHHPNIAPRTYPTGSTCGIYLRGIRGQKQEYGHEACCAIERFRPIDDRDSAIFTQIIERTPEKVDA